MGMKLNQNWLKDRLNSIEIYGQKEDGWLKNRPNLTKILVEGWTGCEEEKRILKKINFGRKNCLCIPPWCAERNERTQTLSRKTEDRLVN